MRDLVACTIVSKNYLPFARVLARSFRGHHPESRFVVLLVDRVEDAFDPASEPFELIEAESLAIEDFRDFAFKYSILELNTAVKPAFLRHLIDRGAAKLVYFDPDIWIARRLEELARLLDSHNVVLTPHLTAPIEDRYHPGELHILQSGAYNLGFIALRANEVTLSLLDWWHRRVYEQCIVDIPRGLFVDQKWIDLVPGLFEGVFVLADPGYNVAYWNLHGRRVELQDAGEPTVNGRPLQFFHFSGVDPRKPGVVSKHQNRYTSSSLGDERRLFQDYRELLLGEGFLETQEWPYAFGSFADGTPIPDIARNLFRSLDPERRQRFGDPFRAGSGSFLEWLAQPAREGARLSHLHYHIYRGRWDLIESHPDVLGRDQQRFVNWLASGGALDYRLPESLQPAAEPRVPLEVRDREAAGAPTAPRVGGGARRVAHRIYHSSPARAVKFHLRRALGSERTEALKQRLGRAGPPDDERARETLAERVSGLAIERYGVNVCGYLTAESGMGEGVRGIVRALEAAGIPHSLCNLELGVASRTADRSFGTFNSSWAYDVNLFFVNADQVPHVADFLGDQIFARRYNVGYWLWELEELPRRYWSAFRPFHEIWTPSSFCQEAIARVAPIAVRRVPIPVSFPAPAADEIAAVRRRLGLTRDLFTFLFTFDYLSYAERKNPQGLIEAFRRAFAGRSGVELVIKTINRELAPDPAAALEQAARGLPVRFFDHYLTKQEIHALAAAADAYVSLHRSEGFGLTLAEAMAVGRPVIATDYAGTTDFLRAGTGFPIAYRPVPVGDATGPYPAEALWAEPDLDQAASAMKAVVDDPERARQVGARGRFEIERLFAPAVVGATIKTWLDRLVERLAGPGASG